MAFRVNISAGKACISLTARTAMSAVGKSWTSESDLLYAIQGLRILDASLNVRKGDAGTQNVRFKSKTQDFARWHGAEEPDIKCQASQSHALSKP